MKKQIDLQETIDYLKANGITQPEIGIVLGTGLGKLVDEIEIEKEIAYSEIPNFPQATVEFHSGKLIYGILSGKKVIVMAGRFHVYEGYNLWEVTYGIRTMHALGIKNLLISKTNSNSASTEIYEASPPLSINCIPNFTNIKDETVNQKH